MIRPQDKLGGLRRQESAAEEERRQLRHSLEQQETRAAQLEATRRGLEGDLMRARQLVHERDAEMEVRDGAAPGGWSVVVGYLIRVNRGKVAGGGDSKCGIYDLLK